MSALDLEVLRQPDDTTCGPTCLHAVYRYFGDDVPLSQIVAGVPALPGGGTLGVLLGCHALERGYQASIYTYNLTLFDPTWFTRDLDLAVCLRAQLEAKRRDNDKLETATNAYLRFLSLGGKLRYRELTPALLAELLADNKPVLTGLSATYLYGCARERHDRYDDVAGEPTGHFVVLTGSEVETALVSIADPLHDNPGFRASQYAVDVNHFIGAVLLGIVTYDANLLIIEPVAPNADTDRR